MKRIDQFMDTFEILRETIFEKRWGVVHFQVNKVDLTEKDEISTILDSYVQELGFRGIGPAWQEIDAADARKLVVRILYEDLACDHELMPLTDAEALAGQVIALSSSNARFYTNGNYALEQKGYVGWYPITDSTFDTGVVWLDESQIGLLWVEDED